MSIMVSAVPQYFVTFVSVVGNNLVYIYGRHTVKDRWLSIVKQTGNPMCTSRCGQGRRSSMAKRSVHVESSLSL